MVPDAIPFIFSWWNQPLFSFSPFNLWTCLSLHHLTHISMYTLISQKFSLLFMSCLASIYSQSYLLKLLFSRHWGNRVSCSSCPLPTSNPVRNRNMNTKPCYSNVKNEYAMLVHVSLTIHTMPNLSTEYLYFGFNLF